MYSSKRLQSLRSPYETSLNMRSQNMSQLSANQSFNTSLQKPFNLLGDTSLNSSLSQSALMSQTAYHSLKPFASLLPVLVIEAISSELFALGSLSVKISPYGWAWLVCGRRLFVWKYKQNDSKRSCSCYELQLPPSDLSHKADLVCVLDKSAKSQSVPATIAVTPEGIIRFWPNIAYDGHSIETIANDLQGQECTSLTDIEPLGCILGTTTSSLVHITVNNIEGQNTIICRTLKVPQGVLAGFGRKMSSLLFGSMPATQSTETKQLFKVVRNHSSNVSDKTQDDVYIWVLSNVSVQKWQIINEQLDRLIEDIDLEKAVKDSFLEEVWNRETTHPNQLKIWLIDIGIRKSNEMILLVAGLNADVSNQLYYAVVTFSDTNLMPETNISFNSFTVLRNHTVCYTEEDEEHLLNLHLLSGPINSQMIYIYNTSQVLSVKIGSNEIDLIDFDSRDDRLLGAGICDGFPLLFTNKDGLLSIIPHKQDISDVMDVQSLDEDILQTGDKVMALKKAFVLFTKGDNARSQYFVSQLFPTIQSMPESEKLDDIVVALSAQICDEIPHSDPRWAESGAISHYPNETLTVSVIITNQIEEKIKTHRMLIEFLKTTNLWERLTSSLLKGTTAVLTKLILCEHIEKMIASLTLRKLHNDFNNILETAIKMVLFERNATLQSGLTPQDIFYRQTSRVEELIIALIEWQSQQIDDNSSTSKDLLNCLFSTSNILITVFQEICHFRQTQGSFYEWSALSKCEYIPWTSSGGQNGIRTALLKQFEFLVTFGIESTKTSAIEEDIQLKGTVCQKIVELSDIILDGFVCQLRSIDNSQRYQTVERSFESCRSKCIEPLIKVRQYDRATALAEKYFDFDVLIQICERLNDTERLRRYLVEFANKGFAEYLFKWYLKEGKQGKLLSMTANIQTLSNYLSPHQQLNWLHQIHLDQFSEASLTLKKLATDEQNFFGRKKTLLSLSKLSAIAAGESPPPDVELQLDLIHYQESLVPEIMDKFNLDSNTMRVLSPQKLIELYISDANSESDPINFRKALDLTEFIEDINESKKFVINIWCTAINRDSWEDLNTDNPLEAVKTTLFYKIIEQYLIEDVTNDVKLPPFEDMSRFLKVDQKNNISFFLKAVYQQLNLYQ